MTEEEHESALAKREKSLAYGMEKWQLIKQVNLDAPADCAGAPCGSTSSSVGCCLHVHVCLLSGLNFKGDLKNWNPGHVPKTECSIYSLG